MTEVFDRERREIVAFIRHRLRNPHRRKTGPNLIPLTVSPCVDFLGALKDSIERTTDRIKGFVLGQDIPIEALKIARKEIVSSPIWTGCPRTTDSASLNHTTSLVRYEPKRRPRQLLLSGSHISISNLLISRTSLYFIP